MLIKTSLVFGLGMDIGNVSTVVQPLVALSIAVWWTDVLLKDFWVLHRHGGTVMKARQIVMVLTQLVFYLPVRSLSFLLSSTRRAACLLLFFPIKCLFKVLWCVLKETWSVSFTLSLMYLGWSYLFGVNDVTERQSGRDSEEPCLGRHMKDVAGLFSQVRSWISEKLDSVTSGT